MQEVRKGHKLAARISLHRNGGSGCTRSLFAQQAERGAEGLGELHVSGINQDLGNGVIIRKYEETVANEVRERSMGKLQNHPKSKVGPEENKLKGGRNGRIEKQE
ncbi:hypothetical protein NDU88_003412 [Pleurodeles waltl]|uniref:Uncharacterized protein n=1 Tax=Pleurodeles waltl TaxID=8319 RepID=A0AAV7LH08_PLEWA|nr:hypothetical protein NDU88_003412 [Pleurodeles waltl]